VMTALKEKQSLARCVMEEASEQQTAGAT
jgi:hypothetical protein